MTDLEQDPRFLRLQKLPRPVRIFWSRPRILIAASSGLLTYFLLPDALRNVSRLLISWDVALVIYLGLAGLIAFHSDPARMKRLALFQDDGRFLILILTSLGAFASIVAIVGELATNQHKPLQIALSLGTIALSWATIHVTFALHYAHEYYRKQSPDGFRFPGDDPELDYWDFLYFSFTIGTSFAASDVGITDKTIRRTVLVHTVTSFIFNAALLGLTVNIAASVL